MRNSFPGRPPQARGLAGTLLLSLALALSGTLMSGCSPDTSATSAPSAPPDPTASHVDVASPEAGPPELGTSAEVGRIVGRLPGTRRKAVRKQVTEVIDRWWEAAYLEGDLPSADVSEAFPGFTAGARRRATFDRSLMTNSDIEATSITPLMRKVRLDLLAVGKRARSVTARFDLRARVSATTGRSGRLQVRGRLFLTRRSRGWQVFGYDVSKGWL